MSFGQRFHIELLIVALVVGVLTIVFMGYAKIYLRIASLVEPLYYSQHLRVGMSTHFAATGRWPTEVDPAKGYFSPSMKFGPDGDYYPYERSVSTVEVSQDGDITLLLNSRYADLHGKDFDFVLNQHVTEQGYMFNSWRCGGAENPDPYSRKSSAKNEIPRVISNPICRRK